MDVLILLAIWQKKYARGCKLSEKIGWFGINCWNNFGGCNVCRLYWRVGCCAGRSILVRSLQEPLLVWWALHARPTIDGAGVGVAVAWPLSDGSPGSAFVGRAGTPAASLITEAASNLWESWPALQRVTASKTPVKLVFYSPWLAESTPAARRRIPTADP